MSGIFGKAPSAPKPPAPAATPSSGTDKARMDVIAELAKRRRATMLSAQGAAEPMSLRRTMGAA